MLTPHPGEAARLLNGSVEEVQRDRFAAAARIAEQFGAICVLKGAGTVIVAPSGLPTIATVGNPGLATGGSGDTLTGIIAALIAQRRSLELSLFDAVTTAVFVHGRAADLAAKRGERGMRASDVIACVRAVVNDLSV